LAVTGNYPGKARTPDELRMDFEKALSLIPGRHRVNLHAMYGEFGGRKVDRDEIEVAHFKNWIAWAKANGLGLDFNPTCFSHPKSASGFTLSHQDKGIRQFWIEHCRRCAKSAQRGRRLARRASPTSGFPTASRTRPPIVGPARDALSPRSTKSSEITPRHNLDSVEGNSSASVRRAAVGSHEFLPRLPSRAKASLPRKVNTLPPLGIADKISRCPLPAGNSSSRQSASVGTATVITLPTTSGYRP
jgi:L-rhamnose isomerase